jgi:hypothetical protein
MHHLMLVTLSLPKDGSSDEARDYAHEQLLLDDSFCGEGGRFGCPLADWFVLGGRWSGILREKLLGQPYQDALKLEFPDLTNGFFPSDLLQLHKAGLDQFWHRFGGTGSHPLTRRGYDHFGSEDDAMIVDHLLYDHFLKPHAGSEKNIGGDDPTDFADLDGDEVDESFIGRKWLVVVDYHN